MVNQFWFDFLEEINNLQMFALCNEFDALSLEDTGGSSSSFTSLVKNMCYCYQNMCYGHQNTSYGHQNMSYCYQNMCYGNQKLSSDFIERFLHSCRSSPLSQSIMELLRAPFIELPRHFLESFRFQSDHLRMYFNYRFQPGQNHFLYEELQLPKCFDRLCFLSHSLGLNKRALPSQFLFSWSSSGAGLRGLVNEKYTKIIVEVITYSNGFYGRFLVLVCMGIGCTVWFALAPGSGDHAPVVNTFAPFDTYEPFFNMEHNAPGFQRMSFLESRDVSASVESAFRNENPFSEITIPANGPVLKAVGLGLMVAIFLAVGIVPDFSSEINEQ